MAPPCRSFPFAELTQEVQLNVKGRKRKVPGGGDVDLGRCELLSLMQYTCSVEAPEFPDSPVVCWTVQRLFRRCKDQKGSFMVETTAWERPSSATENKGAGGTTNWHDGRTMPE